MLNAHIMVMHSLLHIMYKCLSSLALALSFSLLPCVACYCLVLLFVCALCSLQLPFITFFLPPFIHSCLLLLCV